MVLEGNSGDSWTIFKGREMSYLAHKLSEGRSVFQGEVTPCSL